jgi:SRSO17 transposase
LDEFAATMFAPMARADQRAKGSRYLAGLLLDGPRKSMQPMAERLGIDYQALQQFMTSSTWSVSAVRERLSARAVELFPPELWLIDETVFVKNGRTSPCVARQHVETLGRTVTCQLGINVHVVGAARTFVANWRMYVPESWEPARARDRRAAAEIAQLRRRCGIPDEERHRPKWTMAVEMLDEMIAWGLRPPVVMAGPHLRVDPGFREALARRGLDYVLRLPDAVAQRVIRTACRESAVGFATSGCGNGHLLVTPMQTSGAARRTDAAAAPRWLITHWDRAQRRALACWISNLPGQTAAEDLADLIRAGHRVDRDCLGLRDRLGLDHYEGRSFVGWHRHVTLVGAADLFLAEEAAARAVPAPI